jgi:hypothetical protein
VTDSRDTSSALDELLDRAVAAINDGDRATATKLAGQVVTVDRDNADAADLLAAPGPTRRGRGNGDGARRHCAQPADAATVRR